jgi:hypothetical protein
MLTMRTLTTLTTSERCISGPVQPWQARCARRLLTLSRFRLVCTLQADRLRCPPAFACGMPIFLNLYLWRPVSVNRACVAKTQCRRRQRHASAPSARPVLFNIAACLVTGRKRAVAVTSNDGGVAAWCNATNGRGWLLSERPLTVPRAGRCHARARHGRIDADFSTTTEDAPARPAPGWASCVDAAAVVGAALGAHTCVVGAALGAHTGGRLWLRRRRRRRARNAAIYRSPLSLHAGAVRCWGCVLTQEVPVHPTLRHLVQRNHNEVHRRVIDYKMACRSHPLRESG